MLPLVAAHQRPQVQIARVHAIGSLDPGTERRMGVERLTDHELLRARLPVPHRHVITHAIAEYHLLRLFRRHIPSPLAHENGRASTSARTCHDDYIKLSTSTS